MSVPEETSAPLNESRPLPVVFGCSGTSLTSPERKLFSESNPFGFILFQRNCENPEQVRWLVKELRAATGRADTPVMIDQEGGRVARLSPPHWFRHPPARLFGTMYEKNPENGTEAVRLYARLVANELWKLGITVNCAPVLDLAVDGASNAIGDRAISARPAVVAALARAWAEVFLANGVLPVIKHIPGHGRLNVDPHLVLPVIRATRAELESDDFVPFELLKDLPLAMNSHSIYTEIDPDTPASLSPIVQGEIIRGTLGFDGLLLSDDIAMKALNGAAEDLAHKTLTAGADVVLHCNGVLAEMEAIAARLPRMSDQSWARWDYARRMVAPPENSYDSKPDSARLDILLGVVAFETNQ